MGMWGRSSIMRVKTELTLKIFLSIFIILLFVFPNNLQGENWIFYSDIGGMGYYDKDSIIILTDNTVTVWTKLLPTQKMINLHRGVRDYTNELIKGGKKYPFKRRQVTDDELSYQKTLTEINCDSGSYKYLKMMFYNKSDEIIYSSDDNKKAQNDPMDKVRYFEPDTPGYKFYSEVCSERGRVNRK
jgi:hypothetical protein